MCISSLFHFQSTRLSSFGFYFLLLAFFKIYFFPACVLSSLAFSLFISLLYSFPFLSISHPSIFSSKHISVLDKVPFFLVFDAARGDLVEEPRGR